MTTANTNVTLAHRQLGFRIHAVSVLGTLAALALVNGLTGGPAWALWVAAAFGIGLVSHWFFALGPGAKFPKE